MVGRPKKSYLTYDEARDIVIKYGVVSSGSFAVVDGEMVTGKCCYRVAYKDIHPDLPSSPETVYLNKGWKGWRHFLGKS